MMMIPRKRNDFDLFDVMFKDDPFFRRETEKIMKTDIKETADKYLLEIDLPGYNKNDIKIDIDDGYLNIQAKTDLENKDEEDGKFVRKERYYGECSRSFYIGKNVTEEEIKASFKNGTLKLEVPKNEEKKELPEKKYIQITD